MNDPEKRKSFLSIFEQISKNQSNNHARNGHHFPNDEDILNEGHEISGELTDEMDHQILMHRDAHFGGDFGVMLNYYQAEENIGVSPDIDADRIAYLAEVEKEIGQDIAPLVLTGSEAEAVGRARQAYSKIKEIYEIEEVQAEYPRLIADLILAEDEEPLQEIEAVVAENRAIVPDLIALLKSDEFYDPLFPGYGYAPYLAILCLGKIGDPQAIVPIFETLSKEIVFDEMVVVEGLAEIGEEAKDFLLKVVQSRPLTQDNTNAAFALTPFAYDPQVALTCFKQLQDIEVQDTPLLRTYLICNCDSLEKTDSKKDFIELSKNTNLPPDMRHEMQTLIEGWNT